jgi:hypothetical protein
VEGTQIFCASIRGQPTRVYLSASVLSGGAKVCRRKTIAFYKMLHRASDLDGPYMEWIQNERKIHHLDDLGVNGRIILK